MFKRSLVFGLVLSLASVASAGVSQLQLEPLVGGPYNPGETVLVDVIFQNLEGQALPLQVRGMTVDFSASDPAIGINDFEFDFSTITPGLYATFEANPKWDTVYNGTTPIPGFIISVPDGEKHRVGVAEVKLPDAPGTYILDALNPQAPDLNTGAQINYGFDPRVNLHHSLGTLDGGRVALTVIPEPATLALLGVGGLALLRRRRTA